MEKIYLINKESPLLNNLEKRSLLALQIQGRAGEGLSLNELSVMFNLHSDTIKKYLKLQVSNEMLEKILKKFVF